MLVLHLHPSGLEDWVRQATRPDKLAPLRFQSVANMETGLARISGGGVDAILLDLTGEGDSPDFGKLTQLRRHASGLPILLAVSSAASLIDIDDRVLTPADAPRLRNLLIEAAQAGRSLPDTSQRAIRAAKVVAFLGVKGGVGTTTTAVNVAAVMAREYRVAIAKVGSDWDSLSERLRVAGEPWAELPSGEHDAGGIEMRLRKVEKLPGLGILTTSGSASQSVTLSAASVQSMVQDLRRHARVVILDLAFARTDVIRAAATAADLTVLVVEQTPTALQASARVFQTLVDWGVSESAVCAVLVNRCAVPNPLPIEEMKSRIQAPVAAVFPPAAEACLKSEKDLEPTVTTVPDSLIGECYQSLAAAVQKKLAE